jgi:hypothetical protein
VRLIARGTLNDFVTNCVSKAQQKIVKEHLDSWYAEANKAARKTSAEMKAQYSSAGQATPSIS